MVKTKKLLADCSFCKTRIEIEVPSNLAENREYYPFEYINVHGDPEHAIMLFLDKNLAVRDTMVYEDLHIAQKQKEQFQSIVRMSEIEAFAAVYNDPLRFKILSILTEGPLTEDALLQELQKEKEFQLQEFNLLILPFRKTGLVTTSYLYETFYECYFLIKDFIGLRVPSKTNEKIMSTDGKFKPNANKYLKSVNQMFSSYQERFLNDKATQLEEIKYCLKLLSEDKYERIIRSLRIGPQASKQLLASVDKEALQELINNSIVYEFLAGDEKYYTLLCDIKVKKFIPKYLLSAISKKLENKEISNEMATKHLDLLYENDGK